MSDKCWFVGKFFRNRFHALFRNIAEGGDFDVFDAAKSLHSLLAALAESDNPDAHHRHRRCAKLKNRLLAVGSFRGFGRDAMQHFFDFLTVKRAKINFLAAKISIKTVFCSFFIRKDAFSTKIYLTFTSCKLLLFGKTQIYLVFPSLNRTFAGNNHSNDRKSLETI